MVCLDFYEQIFLIRQHFHSRIYGRHLDNTQRSGIMLNQKDDANIVSSCDGGVIGLK